MRRVWGMRDNLYKPVVLNGELHCPVGLFFLVFIVQGEVVFPVHPVSVSEVREGDGLESGFDGGFAEGGDGAPGGGVIDILGGGNAPFDRLDEGV